MLFRSKKEQTVDTCYNTDESQKHYAKWKKAAAKDNIFLWFHLYKISRKGKFIEIENKSVVA